MSDLILNDQLSYSDKVNHGVPVNVHNHGMWARTEVIGGFGDFVRSKSPFGKTTLTDVRWTEHNMVVIGGVQYAMEQIFGESCDQFSIPTLYEDAGIGHPNSVAPTETFDTPTGERTPIYRYGNKVWLFGVGITGTAENDVTVHPVDYREYSLNIARVTTDGLTLKGTMIPFRYTATQLTQLERQQYFGKKTDDEGVTGYYLKTFTQPSQIKHIWKTGEDIASGGDEEEETLVTEDDVWENNVGTNTVETFTELFLRISKKDIKEYFIALEEKDRTRINTISVWSGEFYRNGDDDVDGDYRDVRLFSKLTIPVEYLVLNKDLNIIYRVYGS